VTKPFAPAELVARVQAVLRRAGRAATEPTIEADGLVIDLARHAVSLDGEEVRLTPLEFALLRALALNRGLLMTHRKLLTEVWARSTRTQRPLLRTPHREPAPQARGRSRSARFIRTDSGSATASAPEPRLSPAPAASAAVLWPGSRYQLRRQRCRCNRRPPCRWRRQRRRDRCSYVSGDLQMSG